MNRRNRLGEVYITNEGYRVTIIDYISWDNMTIQYDDGLIIHNVYFRHLRQVKKPCNQIFYGIGTAPFPNKCSAISTSVWKNMIKRCYSPKEWENAPSYKGVIVYKDWHYLPTFSKWYDENYIEGFALDKDILVKGNKIYSPETCCFVPLQINNLLVKTNSKRGNCPIGVSQEPNGRFSAKLKKYAKNCQLGYYTTPEEAFAVYKVAKEDYIKEVADLWRGKISEKVYEALYKYEVEITD